MEKSFNQVILIGRLGKDAEVKFTPSGDSVSNFSVATTRRWKQKGSEDFKEETEWTNCVLWRAEKLAAYLTKGSRVSIIGRLQTRSWEKDDVKKYATEVIVDQVILLGAKSDSSSTAADEPHAKPAVDDDVPF